MKNQYKIFKSTDSDSNYNFVFEQYGGEGTKSYRDVVKKHKKQGQSQLLLNSKLMIEMIGWTLSQSNTEKIILKNVNLDNDQEDVNDEEFSDLLNQSNGNYDIAISKLMKLLDWCVDSGSIDIKSIMVSSFKQDKIADIFFNGTFSGDIEIFESFINPFLMDQYQNVN